jgi:competence protein ComEA
LSGIGPKKAEAIVQYRTEHGLFKTLQDLENVTGIGEKTIKANEKDILFSNESASKPKEPDAKETGSQIKKDK